MSNSVPFFLHKSPKGIMYRVNRIGPRTEPCRTPEVNGMEADLLQFQRRSPITTAWVLSVRYDLNSSEQNWYQQTGFLFC